MSQSTMFALSFGGIWGLVGAVLFLVGWNISRDQKRRQKLCTQLAAGTVAEIHTRTHRRGQVAYYPVFTYFAEGQKYTVESSFAWYTSQFEPGDPVSVYFQPGNSQNYYVKEESASQKFTVSFQRMGAGCLVMAAAACAIAYFFG